MSQKKADPSRIRVCGYQRSHCGYCDLDNASFSFGVLSDRLFVGDYMRMIYQGWRRSGTYLYKPTNHATCCACYVIRLKVADFAISKKQRQVLRKMDRYLETGDVRAAPAAPQKQQKQQKQHDSSSGSSGGSGSGRAASSSGNDDKTTIADTTSSSSSSSKRKELTIETVPAAFTVEAYQLYKKYQMCVHNDKEGDITMRGFERFLVESPLVPETYTHPETGVAVQYGTMHQLYRIDTRLVAVGVVDVLPDGLSSVYTIYDPDDRDLVLGKYTALREIEWARQHGLQGYYMGFYIHDCDKMRYKAEYAPSELMCSTSMEWFPYVFCSMLFLPSFLPFFLPSFLPSFLHFLVCDYLFVSLSLCLFVSLSLDLLLPARLHSLTPLSRV
jgi:arginine-tRNA-protein transferase